jgi:hypothetical protein
VAVLLLLLRRAGARVLLRGKLFLVRGKIILVRGELFLVAANVFPRRGSVFFIVRELMIFVLRRQKVSTCF